MNSTAKLQTFPEKNTIPPQDFSHPQQHRQSSTQHQSHIKMQKQGKKRENHASFS
ncbi:MAG: hypothetical protein Q4B68_10770 [Bacteroidales bacterium]|nr:hypothetical protein [Bacteroidales bacterium]